MKIILIGNYPLDRQESMERFAQLLANGFREAGVDIEIWRPTVFLAAWAKSTTSGLAKWAGYVDKWILFPLVLRWRQLRNSPGGSPIRYHICDHSNAPYLAHLPDDQTAITCHDVLAIRGALGYADAYCPASGFGKVLQKWILHHLSKASQIACVSQLSLDQLRELTANQPAPRKDWRVIHNGFNGRFTPLDPLDAEPLLNQAGLSQRVPFILHIGSGLPRKNRKMLLDMVQAMGQQWNGQICFAGQPANEELMTYARSIGLHERIISVAKPNHETLLALYTACEAFVFPSFSEGFGWPVIEAQACGAPVIASNVPPMPEVSGGAALHADPTKPHEFSAAFLSLHDESTRAEIIQNGFKNCTRFNPARMIDAYLGIHGLHRSLA